MPIEDLQGQSLILTEGLVVGLAVAFLQIVMLAGAAFAVSLRRRQRELALLSAAGAEPGDLTRAVLASGILLGGIGALMGFVLPWLVLVVGRPVLEWQFGWPLATVPPMELAIVLVPIVGLFAAVAASVVPARMAARIPLAKALRARDSANLGLSPNGHGMDRLPVRSALAGVALIVAGVLFLVVYPTGSEEGPGLGRVADLGAGARRGRLRGGGRPARASGARGCVRATPRHCRWPLGLPPGTPPAIGFAARSRWRPLLSRSDCSRGA